ncbi:T9SS type A sorting domain-containing protein [Ekhidna sp.]
MTGSIDDDLFTLNISTGQLNFIVAPDFANPQDNNADNVYDLEIAATDEVGNMSSLVVTITVNEKPLSITSNEDISIYPNPTTDRFLVNLNNYIEIYLIRVFNQSGKSVMEFKPNKDHSYDISRLSEGIYYVILDQSGSTELIIGS